MRMQSAIRSITSAFLGVALLAGLGVTPAAAQPAPATRPATAPAAAPAGWKLVWNDEFDAPQIDRAKWDFDRGTHLPTGPDAWQPGWGNGELQFYTPRPANAAVVDGSLRIRAIREKHKGAEYSSAKLKTKGLFAKKYGRFEWRAKLPTGRGLWPALWMLPQDNAYGGWATSGEIDVMEARGQEPGKVLGTLHYGGKWPANVHTGKDYLFPNGGTFADFHTYAAEWEPGEIRWFVDGEKYQTQTFWWSSGETDGPKGVEPAEASEVHPWPAPFDQPFYLIMNLAVGGQFLGNPDATTKFPAEMLVDYVRVYDKVGGYGPAKERGAGKLPFEKK